jgi:exodeoxyribonuclease V alpha subunit
VSTPLPAVLAQLHRWADHGGLRRLDSALAALMHEVDPHGGPPLWVAAACLSALEGRGHTCLPLAVLADAGLDWLSLPPALLPEARALWATLPASETTWLAALQASPAVAVCARTASLEGARPAASAAPLVCVPADAQGSGLLYIHRHARQEAEVAQQLRQRALCTHPVDTAQAAQALARLFPLPGSSPSASPDWQAVACALALRSGLTVVTGGPGTGKTYTAARLLALIWATHPDPASLRVALAAPTGKAAARLRQSITDGLLGQLAPELAERIGPARTLHALLGARPDTRRLRHHAGQPLDVDVLVVDEASMVHQDMMASLLHALPQQARLILLGDKDQLASVEAGAVLGDVCHGLHADRPPVCPDDDTRRYLHALLGAAHAPWPEGEGATVRHGATALPGGAFAPSVLARQTVMLRQSRRFAGGIGQLALAVNSGDVARVQAVWAAGHPDLARVSAAPSGTSVAEGRAALLQRLERLAVQQWAEGEGGGAVGGAYLALLRQGPEAGEPVHAEGSADASAWTTWARAVLRAWEGFRVLCAVHAGEFGTDGLNRRLQRALAQAGWLNPQGEWYAGRPVMVTRNDPALGLSNGDVGVVLPVPDRGEGGSGRVRLKACFLDGDAVRALPVGRLAHVETAFAMTVHKSQGSEFAHVALVLPPAGGGLGRELVYTGITRARQRFSLFEATVGALEAAVQQPTQRFSGLWARLAQ